MKKGKAGKYFSQVSGLATFPNFFREKMKSPILRSVSQLLRVRHREINDDCAVQMAVGQKKGANSFGRGRVHMGNPPHALQIIIKLGI